MSEQRPNVFPKNTNTTQNTVQGTEPTLPQISVDSEYTAKRLQVAEEVYTNSKTEAGFDDAVEQMRIRTEEQVKLRNQALQNNIDATKKYETQFNAMANTTKPEPKVIASAPKPVINTNFTMDQTNSYIQQLSQPQFNMSFDVIPLPSGGKLYKNKSAANRSFILDGAYR